MTTEKKIRDRVWYQSFKFFIEECQTGDICKTCEAAFAMLDGHNAFGSITAAGYARESMLQAMSDSSPLQEKAVCEECGSDDVEIRVWYNLKTGRIDSSCVDRRDTYCGKCDARRDIKYIKEGVENGEDQDGRNGQKAAGRT
jgi:Zn finger protein HypA/HybF involved in hydrogenase expression